MCTLTIIPHGDGLRLAHNRDEAVTRPTARPPRLVRAGRYEALLPLDPCSGGTWVAATDAGLALALLNVNPIPRPAAPPDRRSRGLIVPELLAAGGLDEACHRAAGIDLARHEPFRLILARGREVAELLWTGARARLHRQRCEGPLLYTSWGLGDDLVLAPRSRLFASFFVSDDLLARQDAFHRHRWPDWPEISVNMTRPGARTVSVTTVTLTGDHVEMTYHPGPPDEAPRPVVARLDLQLAGVA